MKKLLLFWYCIPAVIFCQSYGWVPADHLAARFPCNGSAANFADSGAAGFVHNCELTADNNGFVYCAYRFNGSTSFISVNSPSKIDSSLSAFAISVYIRPFAFPSVIFTKMQGDCMQQNMGLTLFADSVILYLPEADICFPIPEPLVDSAWLHIVFTWDGDSIRAYGNGGLLGTARYIHSLQTGPGTLYLGKNPVTGTYFNGVLDEFRIYQRAIDYNEVMALHFFKDSLSTYTPPKMHLNITLLLEGFYNPIADTMAADSAGLYLCGCSPPYDRFDSVKVLLDNHGRASCIFGNAPDGMYHVAVQHRNHLETWSAVTPNFSKGDTVTLDFTSDSTAAYGGNVKRCGSRWALYAGDVNKDGYIDFNDMLIVDGEAYAFNKGYIAADMNGDGAADFTDMIICDNNMYNLPSVASPAQTKKHKNLRSKPTVINPSKRITNKHLNNGVNK